MSSPSPLRPVLTFPSPQPVTVSAATITRRVVGRLLDSIQVLINTDPQKIELIEQWAAFYRQQETPWLSSTDRRARFVELRTLVEQVTDDRPEVLHAFETFIRQLAVDDRCRTMLTRLQRLSGADLNAVEQLITDLEVAAHAKVAQ